MARPRIFVSSTYFDLRVVRADLERFIREIGYEPVLFERGHVPYGKEDALEEYCYREISTCDVVVAIIGGKFGTQAKDQQQSITQKELKTAIEQGKQVYVFVEKSVHAEYKTYLVNKELQGFKPSSVNDLRVFKFLEEIYGLPAGNPIEAFEVSDDITRFLREQWAGLFQRLLQESARQKQINIIENLKSTADTLNKLVTFLTEERSKGDEAIKDILLSSHPAFGAVKKYAKVPYRVVFHTLKELEALLNARSWKKRNAPKGWLEWEPNNGTTPYLRVRADIFEPDGRLRIIKPEDWDPNSIAEVQRQPVKAVSIDEDMPF
jgi:hypothetical protein